MADYNGQEQSVRVTRRGLFNIIGSVPAVAAATAGSVAAQQTSGGKSPYQRKTFDDHQWLTVCVLCDLIIPADERSGSATQAGVPEFLDDWIAFRTSEDENQKLQAEIFGGLMWLDRESRRLFQKDFADAAPEQQKQILDRIAYPDRAAKEDHIWVIFFNQFRNLTVSGFFSSKMGIVDLPYLGNTAVAEWKGCDSKVWAIIEDRMKNGYEGIVKATPTSAVARLESLFSVLA
jgi:gluconate 2-dehydrogenase gamma chain